MLLQGTLELLILKSLVGGEMHGLGVSRRVQQITGGTFVVKPGSLFPALHRMEEGGWISSFWGDSENNRRAKYYRLTGLDGGNSNSKPSVGAAFLGRWRKLCKCLREYLACRSL
jgi:transcriptional regulator